ncbi:AbfB domain-containing protein [Deinococcus sp.]|uniref:AbfB domain-containing protein n=1 Tax=Deinococcus sp. TaxID=47478 RepID=UPI003B597447
MKLKFRPSLLGLLGLSLVACSAQSPSPVTGAAPTGQLEAQAAGGLQPNTTISLQVTTPGLTNRYVRHYYGEGFTEVVDAGSADTLKKDATWKAVPGLADANCFSFESVNFPNEFLRHKDSRVIKSANNNDPLLKNDATWCAVNGLSGTGVSLESKNYPGRYLRHYRGELWLARKGGTLASDAAFSFNEDSSWKVAPAWTSNIQPPQPPSGNGGRAASIPIGIENVNDSPMKASGYRTMIRFVPRDNVSINRFYFGHKLKGASCEGPGTGGYGAGDGGTMKATLVQINAATGLPGAVIDTDTANGCARYNEAKAEVGGAIPVMVWMNISANLSGGQMYGLIIQNVSDSPASNYFSVNSPLADAAAAGPHARNELNANASGALLSLDPREHVAWSDNGGQSWKYGVDNGQYRSYMRDRDTAHPAIRMPQYGFKLSNGSFVAGQPYYAYSVTCNGCGVTFQNAIYTRTFTELGGFTAGNGGVGTLTIRNLQTGAQGSCTPSSGYGFRRCTLSGGVSVNAGQDYTVSTTGSVEVMQMDYSQRAQFPAVGSSNAGTLRTVQRNPAPGTRATDIPNLWAGPLSAYEKN